MLQEIFYWLFNMSITAALTGLIVLLIRRIHKIPRRITVMLWVIPFVRMIFPLGINSPYGLMSLLSRVTTKTVAFYQPVDNVTFSMTNHVMAANSYFPIDYRVNILKTIFEKASIIWITVTLAILITFAVLYFSTMREIKNAKHLNGNVYFSGKIVVPAVYGMIKPRIVLPASYAEKDIRYILLHENTHIRRSDNFWRIIAFLITALHWFNPLAWVFLKQFLADLELSCDECIIANLSDDEVKDYARSLLKCKENTDVFASAFGGAKIRVRIENILSFKKMTWFSLSGFIALTAAVFYVLLTNAA